MPAPRLTPTVVPVRPDRDGSSSRRRPMIAHALQVIQPGVAADHAVEVDRDNRTPDEAIAALKAERLLGVLVPRALGGEEASHAAVVEACFLLGQACASTGMIYAMHQVKVACVVRHARGSAW